MRPKVLIAAAGTGGHVYPALALADFLRKEGVEIFFVTSDRGEGEIIKRRGYGYRELSYRGFYRKLCFQNLIRGVKMGIALLQCIELLVRFKPDVIVGMGGYGEVPPVLAGKLLGIKSLIHEQDVKPGLSTKMLAPLVERVSLSCEESLKFLRRSLHKKCVVTGNPVREEILKVTLGETKKRWGFNGKKVLLAFGGSLGAKSINDAVIGLVEDRNFKDLFEKWGVILITGREGFEEIKGKLASLGERALSNLRVLPYMDEIWEAYGAADLVLSRAGANTVAELGALGLPAILVPYPYSTANHQLLNARLLESKGQAMVVEDKELTPLKLYTILKESVFTLSGFKAHRVNSAELLGRVVLELV